MFWLIIFAAVISLWSFWRCCVLRKTLQGINEVANKALGEFRKSGKSCPELSEAMVFVVMESDVDPTFGRTGITG